MSLEKKIRRRAFRCVDTENIYKLKRLYKKWYSFKRVWIRVLIYVLQLFLVVSSQPDPYNEKRFLCCCINYLLRRKGVKITEFTLTFLLILNHQTECIYSPLVKKMCKFYPKNPILFNKILVY
jgi:hypothetical protein